MRLPSRQERRATQPLVRRLIDEIAAEAAATAHLTGRPIFAPPVMRAIEAVPRHEFVPQALAADAYDNTPLSIGHGQAISQPYVVALMTELAGLGPDSTVLEIGTGCGYQTAILATLACQVYSVEFIPELADSARQRLTRLGYRNIEIRTGDGHDGWPEKAPIDAILVTAAGSEIPPALADQLKPGGRLVIPVGTNPRKQALILAEKAVDGRLHERNILPVSFVPFRKGAYFRAPP